MIEFDFHTFSFSLEAFVSLLVALVLGAMIGFERTLAHKTAGMRTFALVSMGSSLFIIIARFVIPTVSSVFDPMRMAAAVVTGIGFICGGVIIFKDSSLTGLTTAAGMWLAAGIGMAVGYGLFALAFFATVATLLVFTGVWFIEQKFTHALDGKIDNHAVPPRVDSEA